ncbi:hypothetical protein [Prevotella scopos]|uniref:hypothetical protein n=1 Tax=Prevotella scopos TaxID=589437 RepID=UPI0004718F9C|nr:hypothetical protein [Prevotella scopos]
MESLKKIETAYRKFEEAAIKHAEATETGNYTQANKSYQVIAKSARYLKETNSIKQLSKLLDSESVGVRIWLQHIFCLFLNVMLCKYCKVLQVVIIFIR